MAALDFLHRSHTVTVLHYNHGTNGSDPAERLVQEYCSETGIEFYSQRMTGSCPEGRSLEDFWRQKRYEFFESFRGKFKIVTCHHLDDAVETWIFTALHGKPKLIPVARGMFLRPFLQTRKVVFEDWCCRKKVPYVKDESNRDTRFIRNYIRHELMPGVLKVNPGIHKVIKKKYMPLTG